MTSEAVKDYAAMIRGHKDPETGKPSSWWRWIVVIVLVAGGLVLVAWMWRLAGKERRELARLRHEEDERKQDALDAQADSVILAARGELDEAERRVEEANQALMAIRNQRHIVETEYAETLEAIDRIRVVDLPWAGGQR